MQSADYDPGEYNSESTFLPPVNLHQLHQLAEDEQPATRTNHNAKVTIDDQSAYLQDILLDIDNGYWVILIIETDESGKPVAVSKIHTGIHYLSSQPSEILDSSNTVKPASLTTRSEHQQKILNGVILPLLKDRQATPGQHPEFYDLPETIPEESNFNFTPVETTDEMTETETETTPEPEPTACNEGASTSTEPTSHDKETTRTQLLSLLKVLDDAHYTGSIVDQLNNNHEFQCLFSVLPGSFIDLLNNDFDTLLTLPNKHLMEFLRMASMLAHNNNENSSAEGLTYYFDKLLQVFHGDAFTPIEGQKYVSRDKFFKILINLPEIAWQNSREPDPELQAFGSDGETAVSNEVIDEAASLCGYRSPFSQDNKPKTRRRYHILPIRDILEPAWNKYRPAKGSEDIYIHLDKYPPTREKQSLSALNSLNSGFYSMPLEEALLHVDRSSSNNIYSVHAGSGITFNFASAEQLFAYYQKNQFLYVIIRRLAYSPEYYLPRSLSSGLSEKDLSSTQTQALNLFGLSLDQLMQPDAINLITARFRKEALRCHPDKGGTKKAFQDLDNAKDILLTLAIIYGKRAE
ncbi:J domain-containing protein [Endozoicomonas euniceicola]|uniref:J domain-containing protein n=1 Tax=Endozoicomonas euniceicola TaxID=1234143 RepID=A0ABY6H1I3_9GAMM|nr:hypothetical protein [Endozoicomonas euniceicola]UYM18662.1 hypothetical protein NX720_12410 [Endozoicomonas euniceicola]